MATQVLLLEDNKKNVLQVTELLENSGFDVWSATSAAEVRNYDLGDVDICLFDIRLGDDSVTGLDVLSRVHQDRSSMPVVLFSVDTNPVIVNRGMDLGAIAFISKDDMYELPLILEAGLKQDWESLANFCQSHKSYSANDESLDVRPTSFELEGVYLEVLNALKVSTDFASFRKTLSEKDSLELYSVLNYLQAEGKLVKIDPSMVAECLDRLEDEEDLGLVD